MPIAAGKDFYGNSERVPHGFIPLALRFLTAVDVEGFSRRPAVEQAKVQDNLEYAMSEAAARAKLDRRQWYRQPCGDGELAVLPQGVESLSLVADYPRRLAEVLKEINHSARPESRLRLRLAIHHGSLSPGPFGPVGMAPITVSRLVDAQALRQELSQRNEIDLALIVSTTVYDEVVQSRFHDLDPEMFCRIVFKVKSARLIGYLYRGSWTERPGPPAGTTKNPSAMLPALPVQAHNSRQRRSGPVLTQADIGIPVISRSSLIKPSLSSILAAVLIAGAAR